MNKVEHIIQGLYGISESEKMMPNENARFTLNKTVECLEIALEEHDKEIREKTINGLVNKLKKLYQAYDIDLCLQDNVHLNYTDSCIALESYIDEIAEQLKRGEI